MVNSKDVRVFYVRRSIKLDNDWNEWVQIPAFSLTRDSETNSKWVAQQARMIVDHKHEHIVQVEVYNPKTKLYDLRYRYEPVVL